MTTNQGDARLPRLANWVLEGLVSQQIKIWILVPCFHDTQSFVYLRRAASDALKKQIPNAQANFVLVDDSGGQDLSVPDLQCRDSTVVLTAPYNLGHQGAIAYGLRRLSGSINDLDYVVTMDSDGEDQPEDIPDLLKPLLVDDENLFLVSLAQRTKRSESLMFKVLYAAFKTFFLTLTGTVVRNGNFAAYRGWFVRNVIFHPYFDYCYSSSLLALPLTRHNVPLARGVRYFGKSKMTILTLVSHGFRMLLPFAERIAIRAIIAAALFFAASIGLGALALTQHALHLAHAQTTLIASLALFAFAMAVCTSSCIFFQVFNQTRAMSLRSLTCAPFEGATVQADAFNHQYASSEESTAGAIR